MTDLLPLIECDFWTALDQLVADSVIVIDRPRQTPHPSYDAVIYPLDYGYLRGTTSTDGGGIDLFMGQNTADESAAPVSAVIFTVDPIRRDSEIKLLIGCTDDEIAAVQHFFTESLHLPHMLVRRALAPPSALLTH